MSRLKHQTSGCLNCYRSQNGLGKTEKVRLPGYHRWGCLGTRAFWISSRHTVQLMSMFLIPGWGQGAGGFSGEGRRKSGRVARVRMPLTQLLRWQFQQGALPNDPSFDGQGLGFKTICPSERRIPATTREGCSGIYVATACAVVIRKRQRASSPVHISSFPQQQ